MRYFFLLFSVLFIACTASKQPQTRKDIPGTVKLNDSLYIDHSPVQNVHIAEYLFYLERDTASFVKKYKEANPDSEKSHRLIKEYMEQFSNLSRVEKRLLYPSGLLPLEWVNLNDTTNYADHYYFGYDNTTYFGYYLFNNKFGNYPAVNITYEQAQEYCNWRTYVVRFVQGQALNGLHIQYRLPKESEWKLAYSKLQRGKKLTPEPRVDSTNTPYTHPYDGTERYRFYSGNISELLNEKKIIGSSWREKGVPDIEVREYPGPRDDIGFRCICEIKKE